MSKPLPAPPKRFDLVESFNALALAGKSDKRLPDPPPPLLTGLFVGGFDPRLVGLDATPVVEANASPNLKPVAMPVPVPADQPRKQSLTMQYALKSLGQDARAPTPSFLTAPPRVHPDPTASPKAAAKPRHSDVTPALVVPPSRPRAVSVPLSPATPSLEKNANTAQCSGTTRVGKQCSRQVKLPATHSHLDPTPVLYCHQHKEVSQTGFYVRKSVAPAADRFVEFSHYIPKYLQIDTQLALRFEMEKATSHADVPGFIYTFEIRDPKRPDIIQLKVGRAVNLTKRLDQWDKQCGSKVQILRGWWPGTVEDDDETAGSLLKGNVRAGDPGPFCHRVERLVHIELTDLSLHAPYLNSDWPNTTHGLSSGARKFPIKETGCPDCGVVHKEIFTFPRPENGRYKGKEWDSIVKPVIEKWGRFAKEHYAS